MHAKVEIQKTVVITMTEKQACDLVAFLKHLQRQDIARLSTALGVPVDQIPETFDTLSDLREELHECTKSIL